MEKFLNDKLSPRDIILRYGLIGGGVAIIIVLALYIIDPALLFGYYAYIALGATFAAAIIAAIARKKNNGGIISYGDAVVTSIAAFSIGEVLYTLFMLLLYFVIDTHLIDKMKSIQMDRMDKLLASGALDKMQYKAAVNGVESINGNSVVFYSLFGVIIMIVIGLIIFLLSSIFIKNDSPFKNEQA